MTNIKDKSGFGRVLRFALGHWRRLPVPLAGVVLSMLGATAADIAIPVFAGRMVDAIALGGGGLDPALAALAVVAGLGLVHVVLRDLAFRAMCVLTIRTMRQIVEETFWRVQRFSTDWHASSFAGSTVRKITRGMWSIDDFNDIVLLGLFPSVVVLLGATVLLGLRWTAMGALVAAGAAVYLALSVAMVLNYVAPAARRSREEDSRIGASLADSIGCNAVVKAFGGEDREDAIMRGVAHSWDRLVSTTWHRAIHTGTAQNAVMVVLQAAVLGLVLWLWQAGRATPGDVTYVLTTYFLIHGYLREIGQYVRNLQRAINEMEDVAAFAQQPLGIEDGPGARPIRIAAGGIAFDGVTFRYENQARPIYDGFALTIRPGERIGLVGQSGSGKSTFVKLVQRLYDVDGGRILIDGQDIAEVTQESLRRQIALVPQEPILFHRSLADNIAYGKPGADREAIVAAARKAHAHEFIEGLPQGYATLVGERGVKLSGGERQRVALARAILADAPILILDEATSSLDSVSEALIQDAMETLMAGRTTIVVAHRLSTVQRVDRILVFDQGRIVEQGSHADLVRRDAGRYRALFERQALGLIGPRAAAAE